MCLRAFGIAENMYIKCKHLIYFSTAVCIVWPFIIDIKNVINLRYLYHNKVMNYDRHKKITFYVTDSVTDE